MPAEQPSCFAASRERRPRSPCRRRAGRLEPDADLPPSGPNPERAEPDTGCPGRSRRPPSPTPDLPPGR